jgi:beta-glucanase (GH16 family)
MWSAFYLLPADHSWPPEVDALEAFGANNPVFGGGPNSYYHGEIAVNRNGDSGGTFADVPGNIYDGYHTYGVDVEPDNITWYFDGQVLNNLGQFHTPQGFDRPMYMVAALAVGGWSGSPQGETSSFNIDYIRAYSRDPNAHAVAPPAGVSAGADPSPVDTGSTHTSDTAGPLVVRVAEDAWNGNAQFVVAVDGSQVGGVQTATMAHGAGWQDVNLGTFGAGPHTVSVSYVNDAWNGNPQEDRNLYVQSVTINNDTIPGPAAVNDAANGGEALDPSAAVMMVNGTATFQHVIG